MGFGSMIFGDPERKRREKRQVDLDNDYYQRAKAYKEAKTKERIRIATLKGKQAAQQASNQKPFYLKVLGAAKAVGKDLTDGAGKTNPDVFFSWDTPKTAAKKRKSKRKRRKT